MTRKKEPLCLVSTSETVRAEILQKACVQASICQAMTLEFEILAKILQLSLVFVAFGCKSFHSQKHEDSVRNQLKLEVEI